MSAYLTYFLVPDQLDKDELYPKFTLSKTQFPIPASDFDATVPSTTQTKAKSLLVEILATHQFPEFRGNHPLVPGPSVPIKSITSPVLSPSVFPLRIPANVFSLWLYRDPVTGLPRADQMPFYPETAQSKSCVSPLSLSPKPSEERADGATDESGGVNPTDQKPSPNPSSPRPTQTGNGATTTKDTPVLSPKQQRLLMLAGELVERTHLPLSWLESVTNVTVRILFFAHVLAEQEGLPKHPRSGGTPFTYVKALYHQWILHCYCQDRLPLMDWSSSLDPHCKYLGALISRSDTLLEDPNYTAVPQLLNRWFTYRLNLAQYTLAMLDFQAAITQLNNCLEYAQAHQLDIPVDERDWIRYALQACDSVIHPDHHLPPPDLTEKITVAEAESQLSFSLLYVIEETFFRATGDTQHTPPDNYTLVILCLLQDLAVGELCETYRRQLVTRLMERECVQSSIAADLVNNFIQLYVGHQTRAVFQSTTQSQLVALAQTPALDGMLQTLFSRLQQLPVTSDTSKVPSGGQTETSCENVLAQTTARLLWGLTRFLPTQNIQTLLQANDSSWVNTCYQSLKEGGHLLRPRLPFTPEVIVPSVYKGYNYPPVTLFTLGVELLVKGYYPLAFNAFNHLLTLHQKNPAGEILVAKLMDDISKPFDVPLTEVHLLFYRQLTHLLWKVSDKPPTPQASVSPRSKAENEPWEQSLPDVLATQAPCNFTVVFRLALFSIQHRQWASFVRITQWISNHRGEFVQNEAHMKILGVLPGICLAVEKLRLASVSLEELLQHAGGGLASAADLLFRVNPQDLTEIRDSILHSIQLLQSMEPQVRTKFFTELKQCVQDRGLLYLVAALYAGILWDSNSSLCSLDLFSTVGLVAASAKETKTYISDPAIVQWMASFQKETKVEVQLTPAHREVAIQLVSTVMEGFVEWRQDALGSEDSNNEGQKSPRPFSRVHAYLFLTEFYLKKDDPLASLRAFANVLADFTWTGHKFPLQRVGFWHDLFLLPAIKACTELKQPMLAVLISQLGKRVDYTIVFALIDQIIAANPTLENYPWMLLCDIEVLEYTIYQFHRSGYDVLAKKLTARIASLSTARYHIKPWSWWCDNWQRMAVRDYVCSEIEQISRSD
ncbi:hypothetical protein IWQ62_001858 [Dispira parvispora]|uniref:Uncharacterized protein n=1 Tax=Dispira parvispora TaxID=1520584 RepID=A0A9W8ARM1_9FUNG|nr:hypothetical protein IWQ62_001858 [Dispira parvispora]